MRKILFPATLFLAILLAAFASFSVFAAPPFYNYQGKSYYRVTSEDQTEDSGNEVCAKVGKQCVGYTGFTLDICKNFHPDASVTTSVHGSKAGFYCNGPPQKGLACENAFDNCQICPACNVNADCQTIIGDQFREMYVECSPPEPDVVQVKEEVPKKISFFQRVRNALAQFWLGLWSRFPLVRVKTVTVTVPSGEYDERIGVHPGSVVCEFYQSTKPNDSVKSNRKLVSCGAPKAADTFCTQVMQSRFARAAKCEEQGIVVCTNPCKPPEYQVPIKQCAFDPARPRGTQAPPIRFCEESDSSVSAPAKGTKKPGDTCQHGGECTTGNCVGVGPPYGQTYQCSCDPFRLDFSCE